MGEPVPPALSPSTRLAVLLGDPVAHSRSPTIHNAAFRALGLDAVYLACRVASGDLPAAVAGLRALGVFGANVTIPHKETVVSLVDRLTPEAEAIGAVNTIVVETDGTLVGANTDAVGFVQPLVPFERQLRGQPAVILGAGGAARAVAYAILAALQPSRLTIAARQREQAETLLYALAPYDPRGVLHAVALEEAAVPMIREARLLVNATPVGMAPHPEATPWPHATDFHAEQVIYDLVYAPAETRFLRDAVVHGAIPVGGLAMLIGQGAAAFEHWTGQAMPLDAVRLALAGT
ncbi:MAG: shikimate dehydrogenase [Rhodothermaceae bacterium]|nr:shikimate dehydrogenase [Rhodothermaceae bacterium]